MPHLLLEHGNALLTPEARSDALQLALRIAAMCEFIADDDLKARLISYEDFVHVDGRNSFLHGTVRLLAGRSNEQKAMLTTALREAFSVRFPGIQSISFEACDMEPVSYRKRLGPIELPE